MKRQTGEMLIQDMNLNVGERFMVGRGRLAFEAEYLGTKKENGKLYDAIKPVKRP